MSHFQWISSQEGAPWQRRAAEPCVGTADLALDGTRHQQIKGFGGCFNERGWEALLRLDEPRRQAALDALFGDDGCGFSFCPFTNGASAYTYWNMVLAEGGESTWGWKQNSMICVTEDGQVRHNPEFYVMKHLARFVKPGALRLGLRGPWSAFALAFANPDGSVAALAVNPYPEAQIIGLDLDGSGGRCTLPPRSFNTFSLQ